MYVCFNDIQQSWHLIIVVHTCNIPSSGEMKLTTVTGYIVSLSSSRKDHVRALIASAAVWDHSNYVLLGTESLWFQQMTDRKGNHGQISPKWKINMHGNILELIKLSLKLCRYS